VISPVVLRRRLRAAARGRDVLPAATGNYLNLLTQLLMPRTVLFAGEDPQLLLHLLAGCEAQPWRYMLAVHGAAALPATVRGLATHGAVRLAPQLSRSKRRLAVVDVRTVLLPETLLDCLAPGGLLWCYGVDVQRGLRARVTRWAVKRGWGWAYQPWGAGIICAGPPGKPRRYAGGICR